MAPRSQNPEEVKERILRSASDEFARIGFDGARVDRIAKRARVSKNMLYYYYKSKQQLFIAALEKTYEVLREDQKDFSSPELEPLQALDQLIHQTFISLERTPNAIRLLNEENRHEGKFLKRSSRVKNLYNPLLQSMQDILYQGCKSGVFRSNLDPVIVYLTFSSLCYHYLSNQFTLQIALNRSLQSPTARQDWVKHIREVIHMYCLAEHRRPDSSI